MEIENLAIVRYRINDHHYIETRSLSGDSWVICDGARVLDHVGNWRFEPSPSNRSEDFIAETRFSSAEEALSAYELLIIGN